MQRDVLGFTPLEDQGKRDDAENKNAGRMPAPRKARTPALHASGQASRMTPKTKMPAFLRQDKQDARAAQSKTAGKMPARRKTRSAV